MLTALVWSLVMSRDHDARAEAPTAPIAVQAQIIARILPFERGFASRARGAVPMLVLEQSGNADSGSAAKQMVKALLDIGTISGKPIQVQTVIYTNAANLRSECTKRGVIAAYLTPGLGKEVKAIAAALVGSGVLSVAAVEAYAANGAVLAVEVTSGKPRMSINLRQAKAQKLDFSSAVLRLAKVYQ